MAGGIRGRNIELFELDDQFTGDGFASQLAAAMPRKPVALISPIGSGALGKLVNEKLLDRYAITVVNAELYSAGSAQRISRPQARTARRVASA